MLPVVRTLGQVVRLSAFPAQICRPFSAASALETLEKALPANDVRKQRARIPKSERLIIKRPEKKASSLLSELQSELVSNHPANRFWGFRPGDAVQVTWADHAKAERATTLEGVVIAKVNRGHASNFIIRNHDGGVAWERRFPLYSPLLRDVKILEERFIHNGKKRVRRSKLYYLRDKHAALSTVVRRSKK